MALQISVQWKNQYWDIGRNLKKKKKNTQILHLMLPGCITA